MDYSENLSQTYKYEPQSSHFNKQQYSLHCTLKHFDDKESPCLYMYHLSNVMKHNYKFTSTVIDKLLEDHNNNDIIRFKSDNINVNGFFTIINLLPFKMKLKLYCITESVVMAKDLLMR